jgi:hypothetical protein
MTLACVSMASCAPLVLINPGILRINHFFYRLFLPLAPGPANKSGMMLI